MFKGTHDRSAYDIAAEIESLGGQLNAFTEKEMTCFYAVVLDKDADKAVEVLSDITQNALLNQEDFILEKDIIAEEYKGLLDSPEDYIHDVFALKLFRNHPLGYPVLGTPDSLSNIHIDDLTDFRETFYTSDCLIVAAAGNVMHDALVLSIQKNLSRMMPNAEKKQAEQHPVSLPVLPDIHPVQHHMVLGKPVFGYSDSRKFALLALHHYLGSGMSSLLFQEIREKRGLAYSIFSFLDFYSDIGILGIYTGTESGHHHEVQALILEILHQVENGLAPEDLRRIQAQMEGGLLLAMENSGPRMHRLAKMEYYLQDYVSIDQVIQAVRDLTPENVQKTLANIEIGKNQTSVKLGPLSFHE
ncbi:insulinase family protein [bacterium]|nr:insulinase family protein [bacterium]